MGLARHTAELYVDDDELVASVSSFLMTGLAKGEPGVVVATPEHRRAIRQAVGSELLEADAEEMLAQLLVNGKPGAVTFERVVGELVDRANGPVRVYGEMVSLLCERDEVAAAMTLEELWNDLLRTRPVTLHCGYRLDVFDLATQTGPLPHICRVHTHVDPAHDEARFTSAVDRAMTAVLGPARTEDVHYIVSRDRKPRVPEAQEALRWLSIASPRLAANVLDVARARYAAAA